MIERSGLHDRASHSFYTPFIFIYYSREYDSVTIKHWDNITYRRKEDFNMSDNQGTAKTQFTPEEERLIEAAVQAEEDRAKEIQIQDEIRNRVLNSQRGKPGYNYY